MKTRNISTLLMAIVSIVVFSSAAFSFDDLVGPAFSDPSKIQEMEAGWQEQSIAYVKMKDGTDLAIDLNQQLYPLLLPYVKEFADRNNLNIEISKGTCGKSSGKLSRKEIDIGSYCCPPGKVDRLPGLQFHTMGVVPLAILVHPENSVDDITLDQIRKIFMGEISRWNEVGGADQPVKLIGSIHCMAKPGDWRLLLANEDLFSPSLLEVGDMPDMIAHVANDTRAVGYEVMLVAEEFRDRGQVKPLKIDGRHPQELGHLAKGNYPFYRTFNLTTWEPENTVNPQAQKLVAYLLKTVEELDQRHGVIPASKLRQEGWRFNGNELVGEPE